MPVPFPVRAHASVAGSGSIPGWGVYGRKLIDLSLSLSLSLPSSFLSLKKTNKQKTHKKTMETSSGEDFKKWLR